MKKIMLINVILLAYILTLVSSVDTNELGRTIGDHVVPFRSMALGNKRFATGFHVEYKGKVFILTNKHVCDANGKMYNHSNIQFGNYIGRIIAIDTVHDLCLVTSNRSEGLQIASEPTEPLDPVILVGYPRGMGKTIRTGHHVATEFINAPWLGSGLYRSILISTIAYGGNSGSPVCNIDGDVVGVLYAGSQIYHTETLIVPLSYVKSFLKANYKR